MEIRVGNGFDLHRFADATPSGGASTIVLGGVRMPCEHSLVAHSDGDVLLHAVIDSLLGASGHPHDIGQLFPDTDPAHAGASSQSMLRHVYTDIIQANGWTVQNLDCVLICQTPQISPNKQHIRENLARMLDLDISQVNLKGKTSERIGALGRGEGIAAFVVCLLIRQDAS